MVIVFAGILGLAVASIGAIKDTRWGEPFRWISFLRSPIITIAWSVLLSAMFHESYWMLIGLGAMALERFTVEIWKAILRPIPVRIINNSDVPRRN